MRKLHRVAGGGWRGEGEEKRDCKLFSSPFTRHPSPATFQSLADFQATTAEVQRVAVMVRMINVRVQRVMHESAFFLELNNPAFSQHAQMVGHIDNSRS